MTAADVVRESVAVADPLNPTHVIKPNADGSINISGSISATSAATATAAAPTYSEGVSEPLSQDLSGNLRVTGSFSATTTLKSTAADPSYSEGTTNPFSSDLSGYLRSLCKQTGTWNIGTVTTVSTVTTVTGITSAFAATGGSVPANAVNSGLRGATANPTSVTDGQLVAAMGDKSGKTVAVLNSPRALKTTVVVSTTNSASHTLIASAGGSVFTDITSLVITNTSAANRVITVSDGTNTFPFACPTGDTRGVATGDTLLATSAATAWTYHTDAPGSTVYLLATYVKNL
jgi:hypothetical protein